MRRCPAAILRTTRRVLAMLAMCMTGVHATARAQGLVSGQVTLTERPGVTTKDLATAVAYLEPLDAAGRNRATDLSPMRTEIRMRGREFLPHVVVVRTGSVVAFPNQDPFSHNVFSNTAQASFDLGLYRRNATREARFSEPGVYPIYCNIHARMVSFVIAVPSRHFTSVDATGRFALRDVPAGRYRLHVWHERAPEAVVLLDVTAVGVSAQVTLDSRGYMPSPHANKFGLPYAATHTDRY